MLTVRLSSFEPERMQGQTSHAGRWVTLVTLVALVGFFASAVGAHAGGQMRVREAFTSPLTASLGSGRTPAVAMGRLSPLSRDGHGRLACQRASAEYQCYGPQQMRTAYGLQPLIGRGLDGRGETIVIIDAFQDPTLNKDLAEFDSSFRLPAPPSLEIVAPSGITPWNPSDPNQVGWSSETAIDVEWAHAIAPAARLVLTLASSGSEADVDSAERYTVAHHLGAVVSMSYGEPEQCTHPASVAKEHANFQAGVEAGVTFLAGAGDEGVAPFNCEFTAPERAVFLPSSDPNVTGIGGTNLVADLRTGRYESESVWNEPEENAAGGGGFSTIYATPKYQQPVNSNSRRGVPDVAYNASDRHGVAVVWGSSGEPQTFWTFGGTSCGAPQWAGLVAIADQLAGRRLGNINPALYQIAKSARYAESFHDITEGNNSLFGITGYFAHPGWDPVSGLGSPQAATLVQQLAAGNG